MPEVIKNKDWIYVSDPRVSYQIIFSRKKQPEDQIRSVVIVVDLKGPGTLRVTQEILDLNSDRVLRATEAEL